MYVLFFNQLKSRKIGLAKLFSYEMYVFHNFIDVLFTNYFISIYTICVCECVWVSEILPEKNMFDLETKFIGLIDLLFKFVCTFNLLDWWIHWIDRYFI